MQKKTKKTIAALSAVAISLTLVFGSTLAWQSINQVARNKNAGTTNPGGRLHDDFDGENKDVYVENFGDSQLAVRIQLREFMETGRDAGKDEGTARNPIDPGSNINKPEKWPVHMPSDDKDPTICKNNIHRHLKYDFGGKTTYLPTFNKNKDSLAPDINGTFEGKAETDIPYDDYVDYSQTKTPVTGTEIFDADDNNVDEGNGAQGGKGGELDVNYKEVADQTHTPTDTLEAEVITMKTWLSPEPDGKNKATGPFWVYDTDGWAYWAQPLNENEATGLLLDKVSVISEPSDDSFFAIDVVCQMTSLGDLGEEYKDGFWDPVKGTEPSENAQELLKAMGASSLPKSLNDRIREAVQTGTGDEDLTVTIDGVEFYVTKITDDNKALLLAKDSPKTMQYQSNTGLKEYWRWDTSELRAYLNGEWLKDKPTIKRIAEKTTLHTRLTLTGEDWYDTVDQIFAISEADYNGNYNGTATSNAKDYSLGVAEKLIIPNQTKGSSYYYWARSLYRGTGSIFTPYTDATSVNWYSTSTNLNVKPAFIVNIG